MRKLTKIFLVLPVLLALLLAGCSLDDPSAPTNINGPGLEDAGARYAAIGNSLTAGYMDGGLMQAGQTNSYPRLIATQLGLDNTAFTQPWIAAPGIGGVNMATGEVDGVYYFNGTGLARLGSTPADQVQSTLLLAATQPVAYHNLGVPGAVLSDGANAYSAATSVSGTNPFFDFINRASLFGNVTLTATLPDGAGGTYDVDYESTSMLYKAIAKGGAVTTMWLGNNDVLGPATGGDPPPGFGPAGAAAFQASFTNTLSILAGGLAQRNGFPATIVVATIPGITSAAYFIPVATFNAATGGQYTFAEADVQYVLFPALSVPPTAPLPSTLTLTGSEVADIATAVATYNTIITNVAAAVNASGMAKVGVFDAGAALDALAPAQKTHFLLLLGSGMDVPTAAATTVFSLDGIHPNNVGYGIVANGFIEVINDLDGTSIPDVDLAALSWDPTYGQPLGKLEPGTAPYAMSPEVIAGLTAIFR